MRDKKFENLKHFIYDPTPDCTGPGTHYLTHHHHEEYPSHAYVGDAVALEPRADLTHLCAVQYAIDLCSRLQPPPSGCHQSIFDAIVSSYAAAER